VPEQDGQDRSERATPKRREDEREKGNVAKSQDLSAVSVLLAGIFGLQIFSVKLYQVIVGYLGQTYGNLNDFPLTVESFPEQTVESLKYLIPGIGPVLLLIVAVGLIVNYAQVGALIARKAMIPDFKRISPLRGIKNLFSLRSVVELIKGLLKMSIVGFIAYRVVTSHMEDYWMLADFSIKQIFSFTLSVMWEIAVKGAAALIFIAALDYAYQRYDYEKRLRMTKQEVKDESKQYENPEIKSRIRGVQRQLARRRMMSAVPEATVVVTNPTHIAIALKYDPKEKSDAPIIVAKGIRKTAQKIKEIARAHGVPVIENKPLARSLWETTEVGMEIPIIFYQAIAEILAQVYKMKKTQPKSLSA